MTCDRFQQEMTVQKKHGLCRAIPVQPGDRLISGRNDCNRESDALQQTLVDTFINILYTEQKDAHNTKARLRLQPNQQIMLMSGYEANGKNGNGLWRRW